MSSPMRDEAERSPELAEIVNDDHDTGSSDASDDEGEVRKEIEETLSDLQGNVKSMMTD